MMPGRLSKKGKLAVTWNRFYLQALDLDRWNNCGEALIFYEQCVSSIESDLLQYNGLFTEEQLKNIKNLVSCVKVRMRTLKNMTDGEALTFSEMERLTSFMKNCLSWKAPFPVTLRLHHNLTDDRSSASSSRSWTDDEEILAAACMPGKSLLPMLPLHPGKRRFTIKVNSVGAKHPAKFIQPFVTVSVKDDVGLSISPDQDVRWPVRVANSMIVFEKEVEIQRYLEDIYRGCAIYFELNYYRKHARLPVTKCFSFLCIKNVQPGPFTLALFKAPTKYTKKNLLPLTSRPLYLELHVSFHDEQKF